jgi:hypothetical protein
METLVIWSHLLRVKESGIGVMKGEYFYKGKKIKKISVMEIPLQNLDNNREIIFWVEFLGLEGDNMRVKYLKNLNHKLFSA